MQKGFFQLLGVGQEWSKVQRAGRHLLQVTFTA